MPALSSMRASGVLGGSSGAVDSEVIERRLRRPPGPIGSKSNKKGCTLLVMVLSNKREGQIKISHGE